MWCRGVILNYSTPQHLSIVQRLIISSFSILLFLLPRHNTSFTSLFSVITHDFILCFPLLTLFLIIVIFSWRFFQQFSFSYPPNLPSDHLTSPLSIQLAFKNSLSSPLVTCGLCGAVPHFSPDKGLLGVILFRGSMVGLTLLHQLQNNQRDEEERKLNRAEIQQKLRRQICLALVPGGNTNERRGGDTICSDDCCWRKQRQNGNDITVA